MTTGKRLLSGRKMPASLEILRQKPLDLIGPATQALESGGSIASWRREMERAIRLSQTASYIAAVKDRTGVMPKGLSRAERKELDARIAEQVRYLDGFTRDLRAGKLSPAQAQARANLYAGPTRATYYATRYPSLPFYPCEGTECKANCKCSWRQEGKSYYWMLSAAEHCPTCQQRAAGNPYRTE